MAALGFGDCLSVADIIFTLCAEVKHRADLVQVNKKSARVLSSRVRNVESALRARLATGAVVALPALTTLREALQSVVDVLNELQDATSYLKRLVGSKQMNVKVTQVETQLRDAVEIANLAVTLGAADELADAMESDKTAICEMIEGVGDNVESVRTEVAFIREELKGYFTRLVLEMRQPSTSVESSHPAWYLDFSGTSSFGSPGPLLTLAARV